MLRPFWQSCRLLLNYKRQLVAVLAAAVLAGLFHGAGIGMALPASHLLLNQRRNLHELVREYLSQPDRPAVVQDLGHWIDARIPQSEFHAFLLVMGVILAMTVLSSLCRYWQEYSVITLTARAAMAWRQRAYARLLRVPMTHVYGSGTADYVSRITHDTGQVVAGYQAILGRTLLELFKAAAALGVALWINWRLTAMALVAAPLVAVLLRKFGKRILRASKAAMGQRGRLMQMLNESLGGLEVVRLHRAEGYERRRFRQANQALFDQEMRMRRVKAYASPLIEALAIVGFMVVAAVVAWHVLSGHGAAIRPEEFTTVLLALGMSTQAIKPLSTLNNQLHESAAAAARVLEIMDLPLEPGRRAAPGAQAPLPRHRRSVAFQAVCFTYPGQNRPAVDQVTLTVAHGQTVAIVGANGSGKTTLLKLLTRLLEPDAGYVRIDEIDIASGSLRSLREQIAVVTQQSVLFQDTIAANIAYGRPYVGSAAVEAAARAAYADDFIRALPAGYQTKLGEDGTGLSGGQRQRLCIARAILRDPAILILDEATSQIDADSEAKINRALTELRHGRTTFVIAHRLSTVVDADLIVVLADGRIVDQGKHADLLVRCGEYRTLTQTQLRSAD